MADWWIRRDQMGDLLITQCSLTGVVIIEMSGGWVTLRCQSAEHRKVLRKLHAHETAK
jgi:hypothetical protein